MRQPYAFRTAGAYFYARDLEFIPAVKREPGYAGTFCWNQGYDRAPQPAPLPPPPAPSPAPQPAPAPPAPLAPSATPAPSGKYYQIRKAVWNDLGGPIYRGQPGYAPHLDRDNDGVGCERRSNY